MKIGKYRYFNRFPHQIDDGRKLEPEDGTKFRSSAVRHIFKSRMRIKRVIRVIVHVGFLDESYLGASRWVAIFCICGCGEVVVVKKKEAVHFLSLGYTPIALPHYRMIRRRFMGVARRSHTIGVYWVRERGVEYKDGR